MVSQTNGKPSKKHKKKARKESNNISEVASAPRITAGTRRSRRDSTCSCDSNVDANERRPIIASASTHSFSSISTRLSRILSDANAPTLAMDVTGHITLWNYKLAELTGLPSADMIGRHVTEIVVASRKSDVTRALDMALSDINTTVRDVKLELNTPELGRNLKLLVNLTVDVDDTMTASSVVAIGQDVAAWPVPESQYVRVAQQANAPIFELNRDGLIILWNFKVEALTGYSIDQVLGTPLVDLVHDDFRVLVEELLTRVASTNTSVSEFELPLKTASGARIELLLSLTPQVIVDGADTIVDRIVAIGQDVTAHNASEMEYSKLVDSANAPIFGVDTKGCVVIFNKKAAKISEYWPGEVMGVDLVSFLIHEDYREQVAAVFQKALRGVETANFEFPLITKHGRKVEILLNATPRYNHEGVIVGVVGIGQDITERIVQEQEYSRLIDTANAPIVGVDKQFRVTIWNKKAAAITDYSNLQAIGKDLLGFIAEDARDTVANVLLKAMGGIETPNFEFPLVTRSGRQLDILLNATPRFDHSGAITGVVGIGQDFTDQRAQEEEYIRLIDTANAPIFGIDMDGRVDIWNRKAVAITEYMVLEARGTQLVESFIPQDYRAGVSVVMSKAMEGEDTANFEFPLITKTGRRVEILLNATPRYNQHGDIVGVVGIGQDITERIVQEQEYSRLIDTANAPIFGVDMAGLVNIWNDKSAEITQFTANEVMGKDLVQELISEGYRSAVGLVLSQALNGVQTANFNFPLITKTGRRVEILLNATPRYNELGEIVGVVSIGQDITERIAQEQEYSRLIDTANAPIFGVDKEGCVNIWNKKAAEIMQYSNDEVVGENLVEKFITEDYREAVGAVLSKALGGVETANFEFPLVTKAGRRVEILLNATPRFNEHGTVIGMVGIGQDITDRIAQEQEYARLIEKANAPIFGVDAEGKINIWNHKTAEMTQYSKEEAVGMDLMSWAIPKQYRDAVETILWKALKGDETSNFDVELKKKNGRTVNIRMNATARFDQHGGIVGVVGIGQDLTDRIVQEQEYTRLIDTANAPIFGVDANLCVNIWNKKAAQITKYSTAEVIGENLVETFISPEYRPAVADVFNKALNGIQTANFEFPLITRPGTRIEILLNATPRNDMHGNIVGVVGIGQDITDRIAQEHEYFRLIDTANAPIFGVDTFGCINEWNQKIEEITGYHKSTVLGLSLVDAFINSENRPEVRKLLNQALIGIDVGEMELPMTTAAGRSLLLLVNASSKKDMHGNIRGVIGVGQDYTAKKHMEAAKVNFLASFSHELRTPLNGVLGMLELLREQKLSKTPERYVHIAYISGSLLLNLINDILDLSKIEAGHMEISADPFQMEDLLEYSVEIFKFKAREKHIKLTLECSPKVPQRVIGDVSRLRQVILNLLSNAIKFTNEGSITVRCSMVPSPDLPKHCIKLLFQVIDTGVGMDEEEKSRLFSLFTKLERTRKNNPTGSGLGLAICKQLVELMDGDIDVDSELGEGSEFFFTVVVRRLEDQDEEIVPPFPVLMAAESGTNSALAVNNGLRSTASMSELVPQHARILTVEDNEFNWEVVKSFFMEDNHLLQWETNGLDACQMYQEHHESYDIILMDCEMPIMNGYDATRNIRGFEKLHKLPRIPIIGVTAYAMSGDRKKCLDAGMDEFIVKPISKPELRKAIRKWMRVRYLGQHNSRSSRVESLDAISVDVDSFSNQNGANLVAASRHKEKLDLDRAISDLELEDPMMIGQPGGIQTVASSEALLMALTTISEGKSNSTSSGTVGNTIGTVEIQRETLKSPKIVQNLNGVPPTHPGTLVNASSIVGMNLFAAAKAAGIYPMDAVEPTSHSSPNSFSSSDGNNQQEATEVANSSTSLASKAARAFSMTMAPGEVVIPTGDPIDYSLGVEQCGANESLFVTLLEKYANLSDEFMRRIEEAYSQGDLVVLRRESHSLKGSSAYVAAMRVSKAAFRVQLATEHVMEATATSEDHTALNDAFHLLKSEYRALRGYLRRNFSFRASIGSGNQEVKKKNSGGGGDNACVVM
ncbi:hybrid signal transduction histidine [Plasmopara halstedii]|uniref:histidine kinase n=1 Tax=Plasmopara halstedii TaxID=4781 RepID=A0A0N7L3W0_PLAHL|nr:hybrid signal transduction histidine [Plasmopara halstedii]CEG36971.1 hybrid signal transduction histidine [Plasmopara halstedii]|eukprot:XP_024573340.1 hybrid signal transduction histidine [Plasmopara halstedii]